MNFHVREQMDEYLLRLLNTSETLYLESHVRQCPGCAAALRDARQTRQCVELLMPTEPPPQPGPDFYERVQNSIERRQSQTLFTRLSVQLRPRLAYPLVSLAVLLVAWTLTLQPPETEDGFAAMEFESVEFASLTNANGDPGSGLDPVTLNFVEMIRED